MKKFIFIMSLLFTLCGTINAQTAYEKAKFFDNWSAGVTAGISSPLDFNSVTPFNTNFGLKLQKDFTPCVGVQIEGLAVVNDNHFTNSNTWVKAINVGANGVLNWSNILYGYKGSPRFFEVNTVAGFGWLHYYSPHSNYLSAKSGFDLAFNFSKEHSLVITPAVYWNLGDGHFQFNKNHAQLAINASYIYHFKTSNGTHSFKKYDIGALYSEITDLRAELTKKPKVVTKEIVRTDVVTKTIDNNYTINFTKGASTVGDITTIAESLKASNNKITIVGGVSPEGSETYNKELALKRAQAVKDALIKAGVSEDRISITNDYDSQRRATIIIEK